jgi:hypothetical protein
VDVERQAGRENGPEEGTREKRDGELGEEETRRDGERKRTARNWRRDKRKMRIKRGMTKIEEGEVNRRGEQ